MTEHDEISSLRETIAALRNNLARVIRGKDDVIENVLVALLSEGNILLEDVPGVGKTTLAKALAKSVNADFSRIQFTPDLLPADILGGSIYNPQSGTFTFRQGPIFANIVLADEINRASPRTQSALLEVMTERQTTVEGVTRPLKPPFIVVATQNPIEFHGTYPLPESQLDRFLIRLELGYPPADKELAILYDQQVQHPLDSIRAVTDCAAIIRIQGMVKGIGSEESVAKYILAIVQATRADPRLRLGASPRASLMMFRAAQSLAFLRGRSFMTPDDVRDLAPAVLGHRLMLDSKARYSGQEKESVIADVVESVPVPI